MLNLLSNTNLPTAFLSSTKLQVTLPSNVPVGTYNLHVANLDGQSSNSLPYTVLDPVTVDDLFAHTYDLITNPQSILDGDQVGLHLVVYRLGGKTPISNVAVRFFEGDPTQGGVKIGDGSIANLSPNSYAVTTRVNWDSTGKQGQHIIYAVIDPDNQIGETDETNNVVSNTITVLIPPPDTIPPVVTSFSINNGDANTSSPQVTLNVGVEDNPGGSGPGAVSFMEYTFNQAILQWVPVQVSGWLPYTTSYRWSLIPTAGQHYMRTWVSDQAGNIGLIPGSAYINFVPPSDHVGENQVRTYSQRVFTGQRLSATVQPISGDPDLYVWPPVDNPVPWVSNNYDLAEDQVSFVATISGTYQIEVFGYQESDYRITIDVRDIPLGQSSTANRSETTPSIITGKSQRTAPVVSATNQPPDQIAIPPAVLCFDLNQDKQITVADIQIIANLWRQAAPGPFAYVGDGRDNISVIMQVASKWGTLCP